MVLALVATGPICTAHCWVNPLSLRGGQLPITPLTQSVTGKLTDSKRASTVSPTATPDMKHTRRFFA
jgi:hypothetical protein